MTPVVDDLAPSARGPFLGATGVVLVAATLLIGRAGWPGWAAHVVVVALGSGLGAAYFEARKRFPRPPPPPVAARERLRHVPLTAAPDAAGPSWNDRLAALDPGFSVPLLHRALRALAGEGAWAAPIVESVAFPEGEVVLTALVPGRPGSLRLVAARPRGVPLPRPDAAEHGWRLVRREAVPVPAAAPLPAPDPGMPAARRALLLRDPSFGLDDFGSFLRQIRHELAQGDLSHLDAQGRADLAFHGPLPPLDAGAPVRWLEVELDGWYERIEIEHGGLWLSLLRPAGAADAPWRVWRLTPGGGGR